MLGTELAMDIVLKSLWSLAQHLEDDQAMAFMEATLGKINFAIELVLEILNHE